MTKISEKKYKEIILYLAEKLGGEIRGKKKLVLNTRCELKTRVFFSQKTASICADDFL
jgi:hypothetical protein